MIDPTVLTLKPSAKPLRFAIGLLALASFSAPAQLISFEGNQRPSNTSQNYAPYDWAVHAKPSELVPHGTVYRRANIAAAFSGWSPELDPTNYVGFKLSSDPGYRLNVTSLTFNSASFPSYVGTTLGDGILSFRWGYRVDQGSGFGAWTFDSIYPTIREEDRVNRVWDFADFLVTGTIEVGFFANSQSTTGSGAAFVPMGNANNNELILGGFVTPVPEPSTYGVAVALALAGLLILRRPPRRA